ncbi:MAG: transporter substrate-binding domain-containing protein [Clostridia bacterium]|nr:transporter substrate-binding domain-containing protein [Clostridia bacterium]
MKKILSLVLTGLLAIVCCFSLTACGGKTVKIGVQEGTTSLMYAECLKGTEVSSFTTFPLAAEAMKNGNVDYVMCDKATATSICNTIDGIKYIDIALSTEFYGIAVDKNQPELNTSINEVLANKSTEIQAIIDKYMAGDEANYVGVTSAEKNNDNKAGQLVVATNAEFAPWEYVNGDKYYGIDMEIAQILATELGLELVIDDMAFESVVSSVGNHGVDIAMSGITITNERKEVVNFSTSYYTESIVLLCKENDNSFASSGTVVDILNILCKNK